MQVSDVPDELVLEIISEVWPKTVMTRRVAQRFVTDVRRVLRGQGAPTISSVERASITLAALARGIEVKVEVP